MDTSSRSRQSPSPQAGAALPPRSICVFCGSRGGQNPDFQRDAEEFGTWLADHGHQLVYGAGDVGLMGAVSRAFTRKGGRALGVIPRHLQNREDGRTDLHRYVVTETMHERKKVMFMNSDAVVVLPGGAGSLDEFFEVLTWRQIGLHKKPIFLLSTDGYWDPLTDLMKHIVASGFAEADSLTFATTCSTPEALIAELNRALG